MFSPPGYVAIAELWKEFSKKYRARLTRFALDKYGDDDYPLMLKFGSPDDFCEQTFLSTLHQRQLSAAQSDGHVMHLAAELADGNSQLFLVMSPLESNLAAKDPVEAGVDGFWLTKIGSTAFEPLEPSERMILKWKTAYSVVDADELPNPRFHTLPFVFERGRYIIADEPPPWLGDAFDHHFLTTVSRFRGRALCLDDKEAKKWRHEVLHRAVFLNSLVPNPSATKRGRPNSVNKIADTIRKLYPDGLTGTNNEVRSNVEKYLGSELSVRTFERAIQLTRSLPPKTQKKIVRQKPGK